MKAAALSALCLISLGALAMPASAQDSPPRVAPDAVRAVAPALADFTDGALFAENWERPELAKRDRSLITVAALVAGNNAAQLKGHVGRALDNGVKPAEITGLITHLAFYSGWPNAMSAVTVAGEVFKERGIGADQLAGRGELLALDAESEAARRATVDRTVGPIAPNLARTTNEVLFADLWRRPDLAPRDRSLVTVAALITSGQAEQLPFHLNRAMDNGLTQTQAAEAAEAASHLAFYAGWPRAMSAVAVIGEVFESRGLPLGDAGSADAP